MATVDTDRGLVPAHAGDVEKPAHCHRHADSVSLGGGCGVGPAAGAVLMFFKPWATCPSDHAPAACALLPWESQLQGAAWLVLALGVGVAGMGAAMLWRDLDERRGGQVR